MSVIPQGTVVSFSFQEREKDLFHELRTMEFDIHSYQHSRTD